MYIFSWKSLNKISTCINLASKVSIKGGEVLRWTWWKKEQEKQLSINDLLKPTPKCIEINNGVVYEIRKNSASDEIATKTLAELGKDNEEFKKTNSESRECTFSIFV
jgi:hypothetical protein